MASDAAWILVERVTATTNIVWTDDFIHLHRCTYLLMYVVYLCNDCNYVIVYLCVFLRRRLRSTQTGQI